MRNKDMVVCKTENIKKWLKSINRNQEWLCQELGKFNGGHIYGRSYVSQLVNNYSKWSVSMIERILLLSNGKFETFFAIKKPFGTDPRNFYGMYVTMDDKIMTRHEYKKQFYKHGKSAIDKTEN